MYNVLEAAIELPNLPWLIGPFLNWLFGQVGNLGLAVVVFTVILKLVTLPLDYWSKASTKKNSLKLEKMRPQLEKLKKQYANDQALYNQKMQALYKKEGYSMMGTCLPSLVTMALFIWIFQGFNAYLKYNIIDAYNNMYAAYCSVGQDATAWAQIASAYQSELMPSFLWIKNLWVQDVPWYKAVFDAAAFQKASGAVVDSTMVFEPMMAPFLATQSVNGYLILPILAAGTSWLSQFVMKKTQNSAADLQAGQAEQSMKMMMVIMPIMMGFFAIQWSSAFAIYLVTSSIVSILTTLLVNVIVEARFKKAEEKQAMENFRNR